VADSFAPTEHARSVPRPCTGDTASTLLRPEILWTGTLCPFARSASSEGYMRRREFITRLGSAVAVPAILPLRAYAQQLAKPVLGFLGSTSAGPYAPFVTAFR